MPFKFSFSKVVIIESLEDNEVKTGLEIERTISGLILEAKKETPVEYFNCESAIDFRSIISNLIDETEEGFIPLVHIECHGDILEGLEFKNGSTLAWDALAEVILPLNLATKFNLVLCMSACHAAGFLGEMGGVERPCPCRVVIAPSLEVNPAECMTGFRIFYNELFSKLILEDAIKEIESLKLEHGQWSGEYAEKWFHRIARDYVRNHCTRDAIRDRVMKIHQELKNKGVKMSLHQVKVFYLNSLRSDNMESMYKKFFAIEEIPLLEKEFNHVLTNLRSWVDEQRRLNVCAF